MPLRIIILVLFCALAAISDVRSGRIGNRLIITGLLIGLLLAANDGLFAGVESAFIGRDGRILFDNMKVFGIYAAGALMPAAIGFPLFFFRMIGAGDVKLMMAAGGIVGYPGILKLGVLSLVFAGAISLVMMLIYTGIRPRVEYFIRYMRMFLMTGERTPYRQSPLAEFHFAVPVLMAALVYSLGLL